MTITQSTPLQQKTGRRRKKHIEAEWTADKVARRVSESRIYFVRLKK